LNSLLCKALSSEHFGFLKGRQILDDVGVAQECLHNINSKKLKSLVLKLDLQKAYDCVNWDFLGIVLLKTGIGIKLTN
jgi:mannosylglycoprotein endo-beta-mannosidase